jgi:hypothetical protein
MGTRSTIAYINEEGTVRSVYCHFDGYLSGVGRTLFTHYNSFELAKKLVEHGDISYVAASCDLPEGHTFKTPVEGYTVYYGRDRGEPNCHPLSSEEYRAGNRIHYTGLKDFITYLFKDGKWLVRLGNYPADFVELKQALEE